MINMGSWLLVGDFSLQQYNYEIKMITFDYRMVQGYPLQYLTSYTEVYPYTFEKDYISKMTDHLEDALPNSSSSQSDSENSISSTDITTNIINRKSAAKKVDVKCCWHKCGLWFESLDLLASHVSKFHSSIGPFGLFYCGWEGCTRNNKGFNARYKMLVHVRTHTNEKPHQCYLCDKSFSRAENLKVHTRSHSGEKPYVCHVPGCTKAYSNSSDRFKHSRTHQVEKPYSCKVPGCLKRYTDPSSLRKHVKTYKHFDSQKAPQQNKETQEPKKHEIISDRFEPNQIGNDIYQENLITSHSCSCPESCCLKTCLSKAAELFKLGALMNLRNDDALGTLTWSKFMDPLVVNKYNYTENMDVDLPLDLTVHRS